MKKFKSLCSILLVVCLVFACIPFAFVKADEEDPLYNQSFILLVESQTKKEFSPEDFSKVEQLEQVRILKLATVETGYQYHLLMVLATQDESLVNQAKEQALEYGEILENVFASDYIHKKSYITLNQTELVLKVGEFTSLQIVDSHLETTEYYSEYVMFRIDPKTIIEPWFVRNGYQQLGLRNVYVPFVGYGIDPYPLFQGVATYAFPDYMYANTTSEDHIYIGAISWDANLFDVVETLAKHDGILEVQRAYMEGNGPDATPHTHFEADKKEMLSVLEVSDTNGIITALQPGETTVTVTMSGHNRGTATATCRVKVVEEENETPTDVTFTDITPTDSLPGDVNGDNKTDARDALAVLQYAVNKRDIAPHRLAVADISYRLYQTQEHLGIDAKDALAILQYSVKTGPFRIVSPLGYRGWSHAEYEEYSCENHVFHKYKSSPVLCRSLEQWQQYMELGQFPEEWKALYSSEFFETNSVLLMDAYGPCLEDWWEVTDVNLSSDGQLRVNMKYHASGMCDAVSYRWYRLEIQHPLEEVGNSVIIHS